MTNKNPLIKPYLKWAGGKRQLIPEIRKHIPSNIETYYEPFLGAGAVLFDLQPQKAIINDYNTQLMLTYTVVRDYIDDLIEALTIHQQKSNKDYYYQIRALDRDVAVFAQMSDVAKAARLIFLNKNCYNGLYRVNSQGLFNVPYGKYKNSSICEETALRAIHNYLKGNEISIQNGDFADAVKSAEADSFVYFDPPYHSNFTGYQANGFGEDEQIRLRDTYLKLTERGVKCLLSNSDTAFIREIFADIRLNIITVQAKRAINSNSSGRGEVDEVLIKNWE